MEFYFFAEEIRVNLLYSIPIYGAVTRIVFIKTRVYNRFVCYLSSANTDDDERVTKIVHCVLALTELADCCMVVGLAASRDLKNPFFIVFIELSVVGYQKARPLEQGILGFFRPAGESIKQEMICSRVFGVL